MSDQDANTPIIAESRMPLVAYVLFIVGVAIPLFTIAGVILAYLTRGDAPQWHRTHYTWLIRTFWIGLLASLVSVLLAFVGIGFVLLLAVAIWYMVRLIKGVLEYNKSRPVPNPGTWLF